MKVVPSTTTTAAAAAKSPTTPHLVTWECSFVGVGALRGYAMLNAMGAATNTHAATYKSLTVLQTAALSHIETYLNVTCSERARLQLGISQHNFVPTLYLWGQ